MKALNWAVIGPGRIAHRFAQAVQALPDATLVHIHARDAARGQDFAQRWGKAGAALPRVSTDLATLLSDAAVDAVYIATPHALHGDAVRACLVAGKPVLCEKPLVPSQAIAKPLVALAQHGSVFLMEAIWTRFLPVYAQVGHWLRNDVIGPLRGLQSSFCFAAPYDPTSRLFNPALAGGALLDIGIYNLTMTRWVLQQGLGFLPGTCPELRSMEAQGRLAPSGVDQQVAALLTFEGGITSQFVCAFDVQADVQAGMQPNTPLTNNSLRIFGERGHITVPHHFWQGTQAVLQVGDEAPCAVDAPLRINGFEGEIEEAMRCIRAGLVESPLMPHRESLATLGWMDRMRQQLGVRYPFE